MSLESLTHVDLTPTFHSTPFSPPLYEFHLTLPLAWDHCPSVAGAAQLHEQVEACALVLWRHLEAGAGRVGVRAKWMLYGRRLSVS